MNQTTCHSSITSIYKLTLPVAPPPKKGQPTSFALPLVSEMNTQEHWTKAHQRHKLQKKKIKIALLVDKPIITLPIHIKLTRIAPRQFDYDNLVSSFKYILDAICDYITPGLKPGRADSVAGLKFSYNQDRGKPHEYAIQIEFLKN